ncbi:SET domain-containing protein [Wallemia mellicola]|uniref:Histone-lysine N-methyltransferase, H3 lysine-36 specific n=1 Tax=Wallemia mellicola TaxID=1708541 RepID=A0A4T0NML1_9BASI|nr:hypothetical protein E3Q24_00621 [Wallemia mellicola]TIB90062.1 SET domain-containing protein [Wallemia mellicola]TIB92386.1 SET domain-containing protein [Wallemia mellicola]TIB97658.1 SET domain-containing protein [Wallemia mellicola]TIC01470.1 SET domain-containing protein [Wallemia mellicola]
MSKGVKSPESSSATPVDTPEGGRTPGKPIDMSHLPVATKEARSTFDSLEECTYANKSLGRTKQNLEEAYCDCYLTGGECGNHSDCINRLTQVECLLDDCKTGPQCNNQRFQRKQWANIDIIKTEKKGYGLRANVDLDRDTFLIEYIGEVVTQTQFLRRMNTYSKEGIKHFYFMMLQNEEFIDATRRGNIGRFANHSCAPNCFVSKWVVGKYVKMGIFTKRKIEKGEELTFNYNVDRYGHDAQPCYCGEPNCVGFIGGKTQTDIGGMDDQILDALGITPEEIFQHQLKGSRKKKSKKLDEDYELTLKPMVLTDVPKVITAVRQSSTNRKILIKLLQRMRMTEEIDIQRQMMRMHGFAIHSSLLSEYPDDEEINTIVLEMLSQWSQHLKVKNKIETSKIDEPVKAILEKFENPEIKKHATDLLELWNKLESAYRIPKRGLNQTEDDILKAENQTDLMQQRENKRLRLQEENLFKSQREFIKPEASSTPSQSEAPTLLELEKERKREREEKFSNAANQKLEKEAIQKVIENARIVEQQRQEELAKQKAEEEAEKKKKKEENEARKAAKKEKEKEKKEKEKERERRKSSNGKTTSSDKPTSGSSSDPFKKLHKQIGEVVVNTMSKNKDRFSHDSFKKHAKELTSTLLEKEKKKGGTEVTDDKKVKMKKFIKEYVNKILARKEAKKEGESNSQGNEPEKSPSKEPEPLAEEMMADW